MEVVITTTKLDHSSVPYYEQFKQEYKRMRPYARHLCCDQLHLDYKSDLERYASQLKLTLSDEDFERVPPIKFFTDRQFTLEDTSDVLKEQISYIEQRNKYGYYNIVAYINNIIYGSIFAHYDSNYPDRIKIQAISKFPIPSIFSVLFPNQERRLPRLNDLLQPAIACLAQQLSATYIYSTPIASSSQYTILQKYYGFERVDDEYHPECFNFTPWYTYRRTVNSLVTTNNQRFIIALKDVSIQKERKPKYDFNF